MMKFGTIALLLAGVSCSVFETGNALEFSDWLNPLLAPGYSEWLDEIGSRAEKSAIPFILTNVSVTKKDEVIGYVNVLFNYTFTHGAPGNTFTVPEETSLENRSIDILVHYMASMLTGGYQIGGSIYCNDTTQNVTGRGPFMRGANGVFITEVHVRYNDFSITEDGHIDLSTVKQTKSFSGTSLPPPWGQDIFIMEELKAGGCEEDVMTSALKQARKEVSFTENTEHPESAYRMLHEYLKKVFAENPVPPELELN